MAAVVLSCPATGKTVEVGLETDERSLASLGDETIELRCPRCGNIHNVRMKDAKLRDDRLSGNMKGQVNAKR